MLLYLKLKLSPCTTYNLIPFTNKNCLRNYLLLRKPSGRQRESNEAHPNSSKRTLLTHIFQTTVIKLKN